MQQATNILVESQDLRYVLVSFLFNSTTTDTEGRDRVVGVATRYRLEGPRSNPSEDEIFRTRQASHIKVIGSFQG